MGDVGVKRVKADTSVAGALDGLRVLDFCRLGFGSQATLILGCLGADVIRIESTTRPDPIRVMPPFIPAPGEQGEGFGGATLANANKVQSLNRGGIFYKYNTGGKRSIAVDARHPDGLSVLERLVAVSDVVTESFAAGTLARWGLGYERLRELRSDVIYVSMCGYGHTGPDSTFVTMGPTAQALTGLTHMVGLPGREPAGWSFSYLDHVGGYLGAVAVLSALAHRRATGEGQHVDVSQLEPATALAGGLLLDRAVNGRSARRDDFPPGNRRGGAPQGAYRAAGEDRWVVISCRDEAEWRAFVAAIGDPAWAADARFATLEDRLAHADALDELVESWTRQRDRYETMHLLQAAGVPSGAVQDAADRLERDPQLAARQHFVPLTNAEVGELPLEGVPFDLSATPPHAGGRLRRGPPCIDEDGDEILRELLELDDGEIGRLRDAGALR
jgi:crotonobetainyl-CoA:carnitine CoA-transferase CaiB-like acyl-CoA transferase